MDYLEQAKKLLLSTDDATCVAIKEERVYQSAKKGIAPIFDKLEEDETYFENTYVADKVIGKSAAMLLIKGRIKEVYAVVISEYAMEILQKHKIPFSYEKKVPYIRNRTKTDMCPMEKSVLQLEEIDEAYQILKETLTKIREENS